VTSIVVDASVGARWFVDDPISEAAKAIRLDQDVTCIAPGLIVYEIVNVLWKSIRAGKLTPEHYAAIIGELPASFDDLVDGRALSNQAADFALRFNHPAYDCFYLALAAQEGCALVTADRGMAALCRRADIKVSLIERR
jgi:predicted nucleic acid-binding protein